MIDEIDEPLTPHQVRCLPDELCIDLGFCLPPPDIVRFMLDHPHDAKAFADELYRAEGIDLETAHIRTVQELLGHSGVRATMIYIHVLKQEGRGVRSPADFDSLDS